MADFFSLPQGADPENDPLTGGQDEFGNPLRKTFLGTVYSLQEQPVEKKFESEPGTMARAKEIGSSLVSDTVEGIKQAVTAPRRALEGEDITYGDAFNTAGMATTGAMSMTKPEGSLSAGAARTKKKSEINPLFKKKDSTDSSLVTFYSPLRSAIEEMQFSEKGKSGQEIMAYLNKRAPNVSKSEIEFSRIDLDPKKKYTKDEVLDNLQFSTEGTSAKIREGKDTLFKNQQIPRNYVDKPSGYFEITLDTKAMPGEVNTHFSPETLAHSRTTIHKGKDGKDYFVINELQSDALQNIGMTYGVPDPVRNVGDIKAFLAFDANVGFDERVFDFFEQEAKNPTLSRAELKAAYKDKFGLEVSGRDTGQIHKDAIRKSIDDSIDEYDLQYVEEDIDYALRDFENYAIELKKAEAGYQAKDVPFSSTAAYVKNLLIANIAKAKQQGVDTLVIPSLDEVARLRKDDFDGGIDAAKKALKPTYVDAVKKAVRILNNEYGDRIKLGTKDIDYGDLTKPNKTRTAKGIALDISNFDFDPRNEAVRFAEGGEVKSMEEQMNLFEYGGLADDGTDIEPVTGNEVPPGSMAKEVRDDVPAMLSEGEYVVPADVVRYFGVKFFEDLRNKAKSDMVDLEDEGRIGGAPVDNNGLPLEESEELTPEEMAMLEEVLAEDSGMAMGGLAVNQQPPQDPYQQQQTMYAQQFASGGVVKGYQAGGDLTKPTYTYGGGQPYPMGSPYGASTYTASGGLEARAYVNETTGQTSTFMFLNGQPLSYIPPGFVPASEAENVTDPTTPTTEQEKKIYEEGDGKDAIDTSFDITSLTEDELGRMANPNSLENTVAKGVFGLAGPLGAILGQIGARARAKQAKEELARRAEINKEIKQDVEDILEGLKNEGTPAPTGTPSPSDTNIDDPDLPSSFNFSDDDTVMGQPISQQPSFFAAPPVPDVTVSTLSPALPGLPSMPTGGVMPDNPAPPGLPSGSTTTPPTVGTPVTGVPQAVPSLPSDPTFTGFPSMDFGIPGLGNPTAPTAQEQAFSDAFSNISMGSTFSDDGRSPDYAGTPGYGLKGGPTMSGVPGPTSSIGQQVGGKSPTYGLFGTGGSKSSETGLNYSGIMGTTSSPDRAGFDMGDVSPPGTPGNTAANAPGATANIGGKDVSIGYGVGQVDPGLAAAAAAAEKGGGADPSSPSGPSSPSSPSSSGPSGGNASPGASGVGAPGVAGGEVGANADGSDAVGPMAEGGLIQRKKRKGLGGRP